MSKDLNPNKALIFRITHRDNVPWILDNGLHCRSSAITDPNFVNIGNLELINKRRQRAVDVHPGGTLSDYIPFYFTPYSPMLYNIRTGWGDISKRSNQEIAILVSSLHKLVEDGRSFVFSDRHAYLNAAQFFNDLTYLDKIDWSILQRRDFKRDSEDMGKVERYQCEALVHQYMPVDSLIGLVCHNHDVKQEIDGHIEARDMELKNIAKPNWYFR